jgi:hypothetical protein
MSSPSSHLLPLDADARAALGAAAVNVAEDSLFAFAEPCSADALAVTLDARPDGEPWMAAMVRFRGPFHGDAEVTLPRALAEELCASFSGADPSELEPQHVADFTGEFANMACGLWLTRTHGQARFDLEAPLVHEYVRTSAAVPDDAFGMLVNDAPVIVTLRRSEGRH